MTLVSTDDLKTWKWSTDFKTGLSLCISHSSVCLYLELFVGGHMSHVRCGGLPKVVPSTYCVVFFFSFSSSCTLIFICHRVNLIMIHVIMLYLQCFYSTAQTLTSDISISTKMKMYHYKIDTTICYRFLWLSICWLPLWYSLIFI
jgi:hypothetical protein